MPKLGAGGPLAPFSHTMKLRLFSKHSIAPLTLWVAGLAVVGCQRDGFGAGGGTANDCEPGAEGCFCALQGEPCEAGLLCVDDRCVDPTGSPGFPKGSKDSSSKDGGSAQQPGPGEETPSGESKEKPAERPCERDEDCEDEDPCTLDQCVESVCANSAQEGIRCNDEDPCTSMDTCMLGVCVGRDTRVLQEDFSSFPREWFGRRGKLTDLFIADRTRSAWEVGVALESDCGTNTGYDTGQDPAQDFSPGDDNAVAGVVIGGCHDTRGDWVWDCLFSPRFKTEFFDAAPRFSYRRHLHAPGTRIGGRRRGVEHRIVLRRQDDTVKTLIEGHEGTINDQQWEQVSRVFDRQEGPTSLGFCFRRSRFARDFAGWSVDEVMVAQAGCPIQ